jgi:hypothetical protein
MVGICICEHHGRVGLADVCHHIALALAARATPPEIIIAKFNFGKFAGIPDAPMIFLLQYCRSCAEDFSFPPVSRELPDTEFDMMAGRGLFTGTCASCLREAIGARPDEHTGGDV